MIAGGGDGTINEVATALVERGGKMALGILPLGTANDFATSVGIPQDLASALKLAIVGRDVPIDIARVNDKTGFINMATGGFGTGSPPKRRKTQGRARRCLLFNPRSDAHGYPEAGPLRDPRENFHWQGDALVIGIGNAAAGGGQQLCPEALINDGLLHLRIFTGEELIPALFSTGESGKLAEYC